jgi:hypothetical protein
MQRSSRLHHWAARGVTHGGHAATPTVDQPPQLTCPSPTKAQLMHTVACPANRGSWLPLTRATLIAAITFAITILIAPTAYADPTSEEDIQGGCERRGGTYTTSTDYRGNTTSTCCYKGVGCDVYINGTWDHSYPLKALPPVSGPAAPPPDHAPIVTKQPPAAY